MERLGIFGGTFSPPHRGHIEAAEKFIGAAALDRLLVVPTLIPPHKVLDGEVDAEARLSMCRLAFCNLPNTEVSDMEMRRGGKSYSVLTLRELAAPDRELFFLVGTDMFLTLDTWYEHEELFGLASIVLIRRESDPENTERIENKAALYRDRFGARLLLPKTTAFEISSNEIRTALREGRETSRFLTPDVEEYIEKWQLYRK